MVQKTLQRRSKKYTKRHAAIAKIIRRKIMRAYMKKHVSHLKNHHKKHLGKLRAALKKGKDILQKFQTKLKALKKSTQKTQKPQKIEQDHKAQIEKHFDASDKIMEEHHATAVQKETTFKPNAADFQNALKKLKAPKSVDPKVVQKKFKNAKPSLADIKSQIGKLKPTKKSKKSTKPKLDFQNMTLKPTKTVVKSGISVGKVMD